jgi:hypothetical protein
MPINPATAALAAVGGRHAFLSFIQTSQIGLVIDACQSFAIDNGAFSAWRAGQPKTEWSDFYEWAEFCRKIPSCDFAVIPDVIDGTEADNDALIADCPFPKWFGAPVWHMHESLDRLVRLAHEFPRICLGSSGDFAVVGNSVWWKRMSQAMKAICDSDGRPVCRLHGLRMLNPEIFTRIPLASADSTNVARNIGIDSAWRGTYTPPTKESRATIIRQRIESVNAPSAWVEQEEQMPLGLWGET